MPRIETLTDFFVRRQRPGRSVLTLAAALTILWASCAAEAAGLTTKDVIEALHGAAPNAPADFSGKDLKFLDLSDLDFGHANFSGADLRSANLTGSNFSQADLTDANLTRAIIISADFTGADLSNANVYRPVTYSTYESAASETPVFKRTNFSGSRLIGTFIHTDFSGADFSNAKMEMRREDLFMATEIWWSNLSGANFSGADLSGIVFATSDLTGANLSGVKLTGTQIFRCDLTGANLTGTTLKDANVTGTKVSNVTGLATPLP